MRAKGGNTMGDDAGLELLTVENLTHCVLVLHLAKIEENFNWTFLSCKGKSTP